MSNYCFGQSTSITREKFPPDHRLVKNPPITRERVRHWPAGNDLPPRRIVETVPDRRKPVQKSILRPSTARRLEYLMDGGLCDLFGENLVTAVNSYTEKDASGVPQVHRIRDGSPTCGA